MLLMSTVLLLHDIVLYITCRECGTVFRQRRSCPSCGHECVPTGKPIPVWEADLVEVGPSAGDRRRDTQAMAQFFSQLRGFAEERGYKPGWAFHKFREKYGDLPSGQIRRLPAAEPSPEVRRWCKSRLIAYAKATQGARHLA